MRPRRKYNEIKDIGVDLMDTLDRERVKNGQNGDFSEKNSSLKLA